MSENNAYIKEVIINNKKHIIHEIGATDKNGDDIWYMFAVQESQQENFFKSILQPNGQTDISSFGQVLAYGKGKEPNDQTRLEIYKSYGMI